MSRAYRGRGPDWSIVANSARVLGGLLVESETLKFNGWEQHNKKLVAPDAYLARSSVIRSKGRRRDMEQSCMG